MASGNQAKKIFVTIIALLLFIIDLLIGIGFILFGISNSMPTIIAITAILAGIFVTLLMSLCIYILIKDPKKI